MFYQFLVLSFWILLQHVAVNKGNQGRKTEGGCKDLTYLGCIKNKAFNGHVIKSFRIPVPGLEACQHKCFIEADCVSYNLGPVTEQIRTCELSDFDHVTFPGDVISKQGFEYCPIKNPCSSNPCISNKVCKPDIHWDLFKCFDGIWSKWSDDWNICSCPHVRTRTCRNPFTNVPVSDCPGENQLSRECYDPVNCNDGLGMRNGKILDGQITASSHYSVDSRCSPHNGRLDLNTPPESSWCAGKMLAGEFLQVDLLSLKTVTKIATQGRGYNQRVTRYTLSYRDGTKWTHYSGPPACPTKIQEFVGNTDSVATVVRVLPQPIRARFVRVIVKEWIAYPSMRVELYGC